MEWTTGRQHKVHNLTGTYKKATLWSFTTLGLGTDGYFMKYSPYYSMPEHIDEVKAGYKHYRLNIVLKGRGTFFCNKTIFNLFNRIILFRPDLYRHSMLNGMQERFVLSIGVTKKK